MEPLQAKYGDDHRLHTMVIDNSRGAGNAVVVSGLEKLPTFDDSVSWKGLNNALENVYTISKIS
jgi:hypothetical protein